MKPLRKVLLTAVVALTVPALVACGSDKDKDKADAKPGSSSSASSTESPSESPTESTLEGEVLKVDGFEVTLPAKANKTSQPVNGITVDLYIAAAGADGSQYVVALTPVPAGGSVNIDAAATGAAANIGGKVVDTADASYAGYEGQDARITASIGAQDVTVFARFLEVDDKLFQLQYVAIEKDLQEPPQEFVDVVNSVKFD